MRSAWNMTFWDYLLSGVFLVYWTVAVARVTYLATHRRSNRDALGAGVAAAAQACRHAPAYVRLAPARPTVPRPRHTLLNLLDLVNIIIVGIIGLGFAIHLRDAWLASYDVWFESYDFGQFYDRLATDGVGFLLLYTAAVVVLFGVKIPIDPAYSRTRSDDQQARRREDNAEHRKRTRWMEEEKSHWERMMEMEEEDFDPDPFFRHKHSIWASPYPFFRRDSDDKDE